LKSFTIHKDSIIGSNTGFWKAAGSDLLFWSALRPEGQDLLNRMMKTGSCRYFRCHYTFSKRIEYNAQVGGEVYSEDEKGNPCYSFEKINRVFEEYLKHGIKPIVECDYLPDELNIEKVSGYLDEGLANSTKGPNNWEKWYNLIKNFVKNLIDRFGAEEVRSWYFEVWNEPDNFPIEELSTFFKMYDVFVDAVTSIDNQLKVGGPACFTPAFLTHFLNHVANGTNYVTGKTGTRIDFISYHIYGMSGKWIGEYPLVQPTVQRFIHEILWVQRIIKRFPRLENVEFHLNEWGVCSNFYLTSDEYPALEFRNSEFSALFLVKLVHSLYALCDIFKFPISVLLYWGFAYEAAGNRLFHGMRDLVTVGNIPKPIQTAYEMLAMLGEHRLKVAGGKPGGNIGLLATVTGDFEIQFIIYNFCELHEFNLKEHNDRIEDRDGAEEIEIIIENLPGGKYMEVTSYYMDSEHHNTYRIWQNLGAPPFASNTNINILKESGELKPNYFERVPINSGSAKLRFRLQGNSMRLYLGKAVYK